MQDLIYVWCICLTGSAAIEVDFISYHFVPNDIIVVFPGQILACNEESSDFTLDYFSFSNRLIDEILFCLPSIFIGFLKENVMHHLPEAEKGNIMQEYFVVFIISFPTPEMYAVVEIIMNVLHNFYMDLCSKVIVDNDIHTRKRKKEV